MQPGPANRTKLHEILAVEGSLEAQWTKVATECSATFSKKANHFLGYHKWLEMFDENRKQEEMGATEHKELVDTVNGKLQHVWKYFSKYIDTVAKKERTNQDAKADIVVDGKTLVADVPATMLLGLETRLKVLRQLYDTIPTLQPGVDWVKDPDRGKGVYKAAHRVAANKTEKETRHKVLVEPTEHHPAQIDKWVENVAVGVYKTENWTSMVSPATKSMWIENLDTLIRAVKKARQRANNTTVESLPMGKALMSFVHGE